MAIQYIEDPDTKERISFEWDKPESPNPQDIESLLATVKGSRSAVPPVSRPSSEIPSTTPELFMAGMGKGFVDIGRGVGQRLGLVTPEEIEESRKVDEPLMQTTPGKVGHFVGSSLPWFAVPAVGAKKVLARAGLGAASGALSGLIQPTTKEETPAMNVATGAATGGVLPFGLAGASKVASAIKEPVKRTAAQLGKQFGITTTLGEVSGSPFWQRMESWLEEIPFIGLGKFREKQQTEARHAVTNFLSQYVKDPVSADWTQGGRNFASTLFNDLKALLPNVHQQAIKPTKTRTDAVALLSRYPSIFKKFQDTKRESAIQDIVKGTKPVVTPASKILGPTGLPAIPATTTPKTLTFEEAWDLRHGLGEMIGQARKKLASGEISKDAISQIKSLFSSVSDDIDDWATSTGRPDISNAIKTANSAYKQYVVKSDVLQRALESKNIYTADGFLSPQRLSNALRDIVKKDRHYATFSNREISEMTGLSNIMHTIQRAGQFKENPPTGRRWGPLIFLGLLRETGAVAALPITVVGRFLSSTEAGKRLALSASNIEPSNPAMAKIMREIYTQVPRMAGMKGAQFQSEMRNADEAIRQGAPVEQVKALYKERTGEEYLK